MAKQSVKDKVLSILNTHKGTYYSGQELADEIGVSRTAVWKAINTLRSDGLSIEGSTNLGYTLSSDTDILDADEIIGKLNPEAAEFYNLECVKIIDSTNTAVRNRGMDGANEGLCIIAEEQTAGRGRNGRSFYSPGFSGLYLSILLRPNLAIEDALQITTSASVAAAKACEKVNGIPGSVGIKWINDLFINGRKFSGILTEASLSIETGKLDFAVLGIGFNISPPQNGWPEDIANIAGSLFDTSSPVGSRNELSAAFLNEFLPLYNKLPELTYIEDYRNRQITIGKSVNVISGDKYIRPAKVIDVDDKCQLIVKYDDEDVITSLNSGEISIRITD